MLGAALFKLLVAWLMSRGEAEASGAPRVESDQKVLVYTRGMKLVWVVFLGVLIVFAVALADVRREPVLNRIGLFLLLALPVVFCALSFFGWKIVVTPDSITRSCLGRWKWERKRSQLVEISYSETSRAYTLRFADGKQLSMSVFMQGAHQIACELAEALPKAQLPEGETVLVYETPVRIGAVIFLVMGPWGGMPDPEERRLNFVGDNLFFVFCGFSYGLCI